MQHDGRARVLGQQGEGLAGGVARVDDERLAGRSGQLDLCDEGAPLHVARRAVAVEVEAALADGENAVAAPRRWRSVRRSGSKAAASCGCTPTVAHTPS